MEIFGEKEAFGEIDVHKAKEMMEKEGDNIVILDVRRDDEYYGPIGHIKGSIHIPLQELQHEIGDLDGHKDKHLLVFCYSGQRSRDACGILSQHGFERLYNVAGGMMDWEDNNFELEITPQS